MEKIEKFLKILQELLKAAKYKKIARFAKRKYNKNIIYPNCGIESLPCSIIKKIIKIICERKENELYFVSSYDPDNVYSIRVLTKDDLVDRIYTHQHKNFIWIIAEIKEDTIHFCVMA